ncbi:MAG: RNA polymerase sigma factor [Phycisphaerales bacterium]|nr:MAG: RNA polymerase sigma factor [Phycisphaerales bacterium]
MLEDSLLVRRFNAGDPQALRRIYEKYRSDLWRVAGALLSDPAAVEDVVHDVFVVFASRAGRFELKGTLKGYLAICVANRARNVSRQCRQVDPERLHHVRPEPDASRVASDMELNRTVRTALGQLAPQQRQAIVLHVLGSLRFREIARQTGESVNTVKSRYRCGIQRLRFLLNGQVER